MKRSLKNPKQGSRIGEESRKQLIRREMRFVLQVVSHLSNRNIESFASENNVWRSRQLQMENMMESEMQR
jgi:hypothetical protein